MCGISGYFAQRRPVSEETVVSAVKRMNDALRHRGPDDSGCAYLSGQGWSIGLGHTRLSIIDLSPSGHQPMRDELTGNLIVFNGEIYNYQDIRKQLEAEGVVFSSQSDTEVILKAYACWGRSCVEHFRGIFAFAIWDSQQDELFLARDQLGVKPLYYCFFGGGVVFSSEVRGVLASGLVPRKLSLEGVAGYLQTGFVQEPSTLISGIFSIPPASTLVVTSLGERFVRRYWELPAPMGSELDISEVLGQVREALDDAIRYQQVSDVPIGVFLSGGIDSSAIAALASLQNPGSINTFCIGFEDGKFDESHYARRIASEIGSNHSELIMRGEDVRSHWEDALASYDQPSYDGLNTYFVSKLLAERGLKVALSGLGGDEVFAGYDGFKKIMSVNRMASIVRFIPNILGVLGRFRSFNPVFQTLTELNGGGVLAPYFSSRLLFSSLNIEWLIEALGQGFDGASWLARNEELSSRSSNYGSINQASFLELRHYMLSQLLRDSDQMSMAHSLELRVPLLDHKLVETVFKYPGFVKVDKTLQKPLLVHSLQDILPEISYNHPKQGFVFPFARWFREDLSAPLEGFFEAPELPLWNAEKMKSLWKLFHSGKLGWSRVWSLFVLNDWIRRNKVTL